MTEHDNSSNSRRWPDPFPGPKVIFLEFPDMAELPPAEWFEDDDEADYQDDPQERARLRAAAGRKRGQA